jgi:hypothetical protein
MANVYFGDTFGVADNNWNTSIKFTVSGVGTIPTAGSVYSNGGINFTVTSASITSGSGTINAGGSGTSAASGTLVKVSGTGAASITFSSKADVNWFSEPGGTGCSCCSSFNIAGTPLGRLPTLADTVIVYQAIEIGPYTTWTSSVTVGTIPTASFPSYGSLNAGTFNGTVTVDGGILGGTIVCNGAVVGLTATSYINIFGGTFNGPVTGGFLNIDRGTFASVVTLQASGTQIALGVLGLGNMTFNGTIVNLAGSSTAMGGSFLMSPSSGTTTFNCAIPSNFSLYELRAANYTQPLVLGLFAPTSGPFCNIYLRPGFSTSQNVTLNSKRLNSGQINIQSVTLTGLLTINRNQQTLNIEGGSYTPPAVVTPSVRSGNSMTFAAAALPIDYGFVNSGGTFNPTVLLAGTSNEIIGGGLP